MTGRVFTKLLLSFLLVLATSSAILDFTLRGIVGNSLRQEITQSLTGKARLLAGEAKPGDGARLTELASRAAFEAGAQVTFFDRNGVVLASSATSSADAHVPPEVTAALSDADSIGSTERAGMLFVAVAGNGLVVRLAYPLQGINETTHVLRRDVLLASLFAIALATVLAAFIAQRAQHRLKRIVTFAARMSAGDFSARIEEGDLDEVSEVARALDTTAARLEASFHALETKQRELAALLDSMQEAVVAVDSAGRISWSNSVMQRIAPAATRQGQALVHAVRDPEVLNCVQVALESRELSRGKATSVAPARIYEINAAPTPGGGAVAVLHDVTEIERSEKMRRDFVANVSHELRTPLTSISGYVETLLEDTLELPAHAREFMTIILRNATRMNRLTEDLLALASVESSDYRLNLRPVKASMLVEDAIDSLAGMLLDSEISLEAAELTPSLVRVDEDAMTQVLGNLVENAMKYGKGSNRVLIGAKATEEHVEFWVQDFGPGIPSEHLNRIFERFYRVDKARSRDSGGTGLGLAIVKHIVLAHGGNIWAESELGSGAKFIFTLPLADHAPVTDTVSGSTAGSA